MWLWDALPKDLPNTRVYVYGYDTSMIASLSRKNILDLGARFAKTLQALFTGPRWRVMPTKALLLIGHSLMGLIIE